MRIVIVEDEAPIRNGMGNVLKKINPDYELVGKAADGLEGLKLVRREQPDLIIMDICMPGMDGIKMLQTLRAEGITCKAIVLSAYSDFTYAKEAIALGIENYLLKPIKLPELKSALELVDKHITQRSQEESLYALDHVLLAALAGQAAQEERIAEILMDNFQFDINGELGIFMVWLGEHYREYASDVSEAVKNIGKSSGLFETCTLKNEETQQVLTILYNIESKEKTVDYLSQTIVPMLTGQTNQRAVCALHFCDGLSGLKKASAELYEILDFCLLLGNSRLLYFEELTGLETAPFKYPLELENRTKQAVLNRDSKELVKCLSAFMDGCEQKNYHPKEMKESCLRYCYAMLHTAKECGNVIEEELPVQTLLQSVMKAVTREEMEEIFRSFARQILPEGPRPEEGGESLLVRKAENLIKEYYSQGITLEEIARKLSVSEEYLSTQLKKETGATFTETMRRYRVEKIKELLLSTNMKLAQIAEQAGYADPKYMSKVFRDETGMLPLEYRKLNL